MSNVTFNCKKQKNCFKLNSVTANVHVIIFLNINTEEKAIFPKSEVNVHLASSCLYVWVSIINHFLTFTIILDSVYLKMSIFPRATAFPTTLPPQVKQMANSLSLFLWKTFLQALTFGTIISIKWQVGAPMKSWVPRERKLHIFWNVRTPCQCAKSSFCQDTVLKIFILPRYCS